MSSDNSELATRRVMVDIETLGTEPGCVILSIGAVEFDADELGREFYESVDVESCEDVGLEIDAGTLHWWLDQDDNAREVLTGGRDLEDALRQFNRFLNGFDEVWANSPTFDCAILEAAYEAVGFRIPWEFWELRDHRTLKELPGAAELEQEGTEHDALDDARHQARVASLTLEVLGGGDDV